MLHAGQPQAAQAVQTRRQGFHLEEIRITGIYIMQNTMVRGGGGEMAGEKK